MVADREPGNNFLTYTLPQTDGNPPPSTVACPIGYYFDGQTTGVFACHACPTGSITRQPGSTSLDDCVVAPGYYLNTDTKKMTKCPNNFAGNGYYRTGWIGYKFAQDTDGRTACKACGDKILSEPREPDEMPVLDDGGDPFVGKIAATSDSCYIEAGWGITIDPNDFKSYRAIVPCPANTYGGFHVWGVVSPILQAKGYPTSQGFADEMVDWCSSPPLCFFISADSMPASQAL